MLYVICLFLFSGADIIDQSQYGEPGEGEGEGEGLTGSGCRGFLNPYMPGDLLDDCRLDLSYF